MTAIASTPLKFDIGRVLRRTLGLIARNWLVFGLLTLVLAVLPQIGLQLAAGRLLVDGAGSRLAIATPQFWVTSIGGYAIAAVLSAALVQGALADLAGRKARFGECVATSFPMWPSAAVVAVAVNLAMAFGTVFLVVPGLMIGMAWMISVQVLVVEHTGIRKSFGRSADLTRDRRGALFGLTLIYIAVALVLVLLFRVVGDAITGALAHRIEPLRLAQLTGASRLVASSCRTALLEAVYSVGLAAIYVELRTLREGVVPETLASVFD